MDSRISQERSQENSATRPDSYPVIITGDTQTADRAVFFVETYRVMGERLVYVLDVQANKGNREDIYSLVLVKANH